MTTDRLGDRLPQKLYDIAAAGLSIVVPTRNDLKVGEGFTGSLHLPGREPIPCQIELRNIRPFPGDPSHKLAGCRFASLNDSDREAVSSLLASLE